MVMESLQRLDPPQPLGKLTLLARLGEGGMATVYVAATGHGPLARLCAVKLLRADIPDADYRTRFLDEATLVVRLHHNNLIDVREAGEQSGQLYIVMELCEGRDLADLWDRCASVGRAFPVALSVYLVREALRGLHYAHTFGGLSLVHRDISPSNLLIDWAGAVRVADFGLATSVLKATSTMPGMVFGKVGYMAPEQATRRELDARTDVYSCGVVLWELLTGRPLREAGLDTNAVAGFSAARPSSLSRRVDAVLDGIVMKALALDPEDRFPDAAQFMRALSEWLVANAPQTDQETLAEFMRGLFGDAQAKDHEAYGQLLAHVVGPTTGVFRHGDTARPTIDAVPITDGEELPVGLVIAERYRVTAELGRGGMGTVYLAEHVTVGRKVAVKVLTREWSAHETVARRFREEARAASAAGHPNIVEVFDAGTLPDGRLYLVMEHLAGRSLYDELCETGPMPIDRALTIFREIARGIAAAHAVGIIHRDLKPDNVMLVERAGHTAVKLLDFGIAASADRAAQERRLTQEGHTLGTPEYMAPEQAKGRAPDARVDVYALGAMFYELVAGTPPFVGDNYVEVLTRKTTEPAPRLELLREGVPDHLVALIHACLEIDPQRRPPTVMAVLASLDAPASSTALVPVDGAAATRVDRIAVVRAHPVDEPAPRGRGPWIVAGAAVLFVALGFGAWRITASADEGERTSDAKIEQKVDAKPEPEPKAEPTLEAKPPEPVIADPPAKPPEPVPQPDPVPLADPPIEPPDDPPDEPPTTEKPAAKAPDLESQTCKDHRAKGIAAKNRLDWPAALANVNKKACWGGSHRSEAAAIKVNGYFNLKRFAECAKAGKYATTEREVKLAQGCATRAKGG